MQTAYVEIAHRHRSTSEHNVRRFAIFAILVESREKSGRSPLTSGVVKTWRPPGFNVRGISRKQASGSKTCSTTSCVTWRSMLASGKAHGGQVLASPAVVRHAARNAVEVLRADIAGSLDESHG